MATALEGLRGQHHASAAFTPGKDPVPIVQEAGWAPGPVWTGAENLFPTGIRSPDSPARSQSLYRLTYPTHGRRRVTGKSTQQRGVEEANENGKETSHSSHTNETALKYIPAGNLRSTRHPLRFTDSHRTRSNTTLNKLLYLAR